MIIDDARVLWRLLRGQPNYGTHAERLTAFYGPQAADYDRFRERLLQGRAELIKLLDPPSGSQIIELGGGTGRNLLYFNERLATFKHLEIVDLCPALLAQARQRFQNFTNIDLIEADVTTYQPAGPVDCVYFSYALTMIPDWRAAIFNAIKMLRPGGSLGVIDFYISDQNDGPGDVKHNAFTRWFWPRWFRHDGVNLTPDHLKLLRETLPNHRYWEYRAKVPYLPGLRVPYYLFIGIKNS